MNEKIFLQLDRQLIQLDRPETSVGRSTSADVIIIDPSVSRRHLLLGLVEGRVTATDLDSSNGTTLNGIPLLGTTTLSNGDVGDVDLKVRFLGHQADLPTRPDNHIAAETERRDGTRRSVEILVPTPAARAASCPQLRTSAREVCSCGRRSATIALTPAAT